MRFWELDFARGVSIILIVLFNYAFALHYLGIYQVTTGWGFWWLFPRLAAGALIFVSGISTVVSYERNKNKARRIRRGAAIFGWGLAITLATFIVVPASTVWFGILHLIGLSVILSPFLMKMGKKNLLLGLAIIFAGFFLGAPTTETVWLLFLGFIPYGFSTLDYFPLIPWMGVFLIGMYAGITYYKGGKRRFKIIKSPGVGKVINLTGRHSLFVYIVHIPVLLAILYISGLI